MIDCDKFLPITEKHWVVLSSVFTEDELQALKRLALKKWEQGQFQPAKVGRSQSQQRVDQVRSDWTLWIDLKDPEFHFFAQKIDSLILQLNQCFFLGLKEFECHFARYSSGQYYAEHIDQSQTASFLHGERVISFVLYLNSNWQPGDGGELQMRLGEKDNENLVLIEPRWGQLVLFRSDTVPHAVLPSRTERWSLTGWFRRI